MWNCLTKESIAQTDRNRLCLCVAVKCSFTKLAANAGLLVATEGKLPVKGVVGVDPDSSGTKVVGYLDGSVETCGVDCGGKTVCAVVADGNNLVLGLELGDGADGAEDFFLHDLHVFGDIAEDGRFDEITLVTLPLATSLNLGTLLFAVINVATNC
jgi:hypothetical protein